MSSMGQELASVKLKTNGPTELKVSDLYTWIIWQYPRKLKQGLCGAVKPPLAGQGWYPAEIIQARKTILVHGEVIKPFETPSEAADWLSSLAAYKSEVANSSKAANNSEQL